MNRLAILLTALSLLLLTACKNKESEPTARAEEPYVPLDRLDRSTAYTPAPVESTIGDTTTYAAAEPIATGDETLSATDSSYDAGAGNLYTVCKGDTLFALARRFYNDESKWRDIWSANRSQIPDPDKIRTGMQLTLP